MQQTLLAVAAILAFSFFALNQHRANASVERGALGNEIELAATDLARAQLVDITARAYDEADVGVSGFRKTTDGLSTVLGPDAGEDDVAFYDDVDDFHGRIWTATATWDGQPMQFRLGVVVRYVVPANPEQTAGSPTLAKEVSVTVQEINPTAERRPVTVTLAQVVTPAWNMLHG